MIIQAAVTLKKSMQILLTTCLKFLATPTSTTTDAMALKLLETLLGLSDIDNITLRLLQQNHCDYCHDTALEHFTIINRARHHDTCVPLDTAKASISIGMNLWVSIVVKFN